MRKGVDSVSGNIVDVVNSRVYPGTLEISGGRIAKIVEDDKEHDSFIVPGLVDAHVHIESSMLVPSEFARLAVVHGTVATVSDPHEIANVLGMDGVRYMMDNGELVNFKFYFGAPSCVPATVFESSGAKIGVAQVEKLLKERRIKFLSEVMNFPGVLNDDPEVMGKIGVAIRYGKVIDGHAPGLRGEALEKYVKAGISTDHECFDKDEAVEKVKLGMHILIREGSAAKNFDALCFLIEEHPDRCMFCSDDKHPNDLARGHINEVVKRALDMGMDRMRVLRCACVNPVLHYGLDVGLLQTGDAADFIVVDNFEEFNILKTYINGELVAQDGKCLLPKVPVRVVNKFRAGKKKVLNFFVKKEGERINVIEAIDGQLITNKAVETVKVSHGNVVSDTQRDVLKIAVVNRYRDARPAIGFVKNFGLKKGAIACSVAHDSHNVIAVGATDEAICDAVNLVIENKGGLSVVYDDVKEVLPLPVCGIMSNEDGLCVAEAYLRLDEAARELGSKLRAPFMSLSFMALLVIPKIKLSDRGLFDGEKFEMMSLFAR